MQSARRSVRSCRTKREFLALKKIRIASVAVMRPLANDSTIPRFNQAKRANFCSGVLSELERSIWRSIALVMLFIVASPLEKPLLQHLVRTRVQSSVLHRYYLT